MSYDFKQHLKIPWYKKPWVWVCGLISAARENRKKAIDAKKFYLVNRWDHTTTYYRDLNDESTKTRQELLFYRCYENSIGERKIEIDCESRYAMERAKMTKLYQYLKDWELGHISTNNMKDAWKRTYADSR